MCVCGGGGGELMTSQKYFGHFFQSFVFSQFVQKCNKKCSPLFSRFCQTWSDLSRVFITEGGGGHNTRGEGVPFIKTLERDRIRPQ